MAASMPVKTSFSPDKKHSDIERWVSVYPAYVNSKKTRQEGRRLAKENCVENPTYVEIRDVLGTTNLKIGVENKLYPREKSKSYVDYTKMENYNIIEALHQKLDSKNEALQIMRKEMEIFRTERDQFKLMAETLQLRQSALKRNENSKFDFSNSSGVAKLLNESHVKNIKLSTEVETLKQRLGELSGDVKILREKLITMQNSENMSNHSDTNECEWKTERMKLITELEALKKRNVKISLEFKTCLDEKEDSVNDREALKSKIHRLNHELQIALKANNESPSTMKVLDIDSLIIENKYLFEKLTLCENELRLTKKSEDKLRQIVVSKKTKQSILKVEKNQMISESQAKVILDNDSTTKHEKVEELKSLCLTLLDNLNDKNLALEHQKNANKMLAKQNVELLQRCDNSTSLSPSQILLSGYNSSKECDEENDIAAGESKSPAAAAAATTISSSAVVGVNLLNKKEYCTDDDFDSLSTSTNSNRSLMSSEYENEYTNEEIIKKSPAMGLANKKRLEDLKDLPQEIANLVVENLHQLDLNE